MTLNLHQVLATLARSRPIFHSEKDFQLALAWQIQREHPNAHIRLEARPLRDRRLYADLMVRLNDESLAVELKYHTKVFEAEVAGERFGLLNQGAQPITRYRFVADIARIESLMEERASTSGWAVFLTNDPLFWNRSTRAGIADAFLIHQGSRLAGELAWPDHAATGQRKGVSDRIRLAREYVLGWSNYSRLSGPGPGLFRYTAVQI